MSLLVHQAVVVNVLHILIELVNNWQSVRYFKLFYLFVTDALQVLEESAEGVLVRHNDHPLLVLNLAYYLVFPEGHHPLHSVLQRLDGWQSISWDELVLFVIAWVAIIVQFQSWWMI